VLSDVRGCHQALATFYLLPCPILLTANCSINQAAKQRGRQKSEESSSQNALNKLGPERESVASAGTNTFYPLYFFLFFRMLYGHLGCTPIHPSTKSPATTHNNVLLSLEEYL